MSTTASAINPTDSAANSVKLTESQNLIAQKNRGLLNETRTRRFINDMITLYMKIVEANDGNA
jgi:hypothetical protein